MRVAIIADTHLQRLRLRQLLQQCGYRIIMNADPALLTAGELEGCRPDAWLVSLTTTAEESRQLLLDYLYQQKEPVLYGEGEAPGVGSEDFPRWQRTVLKKLRAALPSEQEPQTGGGLQQSSATLPAAIAATDSAAPAEQVWLLVAALDGPLAVKEFLEHLPADLPLGLLYAQHMEPRFEKYLPRVVGKHSSWPVRQVQDGVPVREGEVLVVPLCQEISFAGDGRVQYQSQPWPDNHTPSFERMLHNLVRQFGPDSGMIVFSGMEMLTEDACADATSQGVRIWIQSGQSSTAHPGPDSVRTSAYSSYGAAPRELALTLSSHIRNLRSRAGRRQGAKHVGSCGN